jgi:hypothetical protein
MTDSNEPYETVYVTNFDRKHINDIMLDKPGFDWWTCDLLRLCRRADGESLARIQMGFPEVVELYREWRDGRV